MNSLIIDQINKDL